MFIYLIVNHTTGKYYVGQHKGNSLKKYLQQKLHHAQKDISSNSRLYRSMRAHPDKNSWSIHALRSDIQDREELDQTEKDFIVFLKAQDPEYGYNICRGGEGFTGPHTQASRKKTSESIRKAMINPIVRARIVKGLEKGWHDPQSRTNLAKANRLRLLIPAEHTKAVKAAQRLHTPEIQVKSAKTRKIIWENPETYAKAVAAGKKGWSKENYSRTLEAVRRTNSSPKYRANMSKVKKGKKFGLLFRAKMSEVARKREAKKREANSHLLLS
jgi:hypothetical protein